MLKYIKFSRAVVNGQICNLEDIYNFIEKKKKTFMLKYVNIFPEVDINGQNL